MSEPIAPSQPEPAVNPVQAAIENISTPPQSSSDYLSDLANRLAAVSNQPDEPAPSEPAAPVEPAAVEHTEPTDPQPGPDGKDTPQSSWAKLRNKAETAEKKAFELEQKIAEYETKLKTPVIDPELKKRAELATEYEKELALVKVEATAPYIEQVTKPAEEIWKRLDTITKGYGTTLTAEDIVAAYNIADPKARREKLSAMVEEFDIEDRARIRTLSEDWANVQERHATIKANASAALSEAKQIEEQSRLAMTAKERESFNKAADRTLETLKKALPKLAEDDEGMDKILSNVQQQITDSAFNLDTPEVRAYSAAAGVLVPDLVKAIRARDVKLAELEKTVAAYTKAGPKISGSTAAPAASSSDPTPAGMTLGEAAARRFTEFMSNNAF